MQNLRNIAAFSQLRQQTSRLSEGLTAEDMVIQSMPDASPTKWHLAHTTWFFETFILKPHAPGYQVFDPNFHFLFNSYYESEGKRHARPQRGLLSRPPLEEVLAYRTHVDDAIENFLGSSQLPSPVLDLLEVGIHHEMQHQELMLTDILHAFSCNALGPSLSDQPLPTQVATDMQFTSFEGGLIEVGHADDQGFAYDNERPRHQTCLGEFALASRTVTNGEWLAFMADGGYQNPLLWLSDGWACAQSQNWRAPLYWRESDDGWQHFGLSGVVALNLDQPVCHISYYEADAFARWAGKRLPTEFEWEHAATAEKLDPSVGNFLEQLLWQPSATKSDRNLNGMYGHVWEWTQSPYIAYPGFKPEQGALGEYNGKFMVNQMVLKGGSCVTPAHQMRASYRNFFHPHQRWQFTGLRLANA